MHGRTYILGPWATSNGFEVKVGDHFINVVNSTGVLNANLIPPSYMHVAKVPLQAGDSDDIAFAWQNPVDADILVHRVIVDITAAGGTASSVMDVGVTNANDGTDDCFFDDMNINSVKVEDHLRTAGAGQGGVHKVDQRGGTNDYITGKILAANANDLEGNVYIYYTSV